MQTESRRDVSAVHVEIRHAWYPRLAERRGKRALLPLRTSKRLLEQPAICLLDARFWGFGFDSASGFDRADTGREFRGRIGMFSGACGRFAFSLVGIRREIDERKSRTDLAVPRFDGTAHDFAACCRFWWDLAALPSADRPSHAPKKRRFCPAVSVWTRNSLNVSLHQYPFSRCRAALASAHGVLAK